MGENGILKQLTKRLAKRVLQAEMTHHLDYAKHDYQGKADKEALDDFLSQTPDVELADTDLVINSCDDEYHNEPNLPTTKSSVKPKKPMPETTQPTKPSALTLVNYNWISHETATAVLSHN